MTDTQKGYKLRISLLDVDLGYENTREVELSFVTMVTELHRIIQVLYGLENCHMWMFGNQEEKSTREAHPFLDGGKNPDVDLYSNAEEIVNADETLLAQFISKRFKTIYYTYDFGTMTQWKIEYKGLTKVPLRQHICTSAIGYYLLEDMPIRQQIELMEIYKQQDKKKLKKEYDWFESWKHFEHIIQPTLKKLTVKNMNTAINQVGRVPL